MNETIPARLEAVRRRIGEAARRAGRDPGGVRLVAVGKTWPAPVVARAVRAGVTDLGENRVQEAAAKKPEIPPARWHMIGPLQSNKARLALETFDVIQTIDRPRIAERLGRLLETDWPGRRLPVLLEINVGGEPQKAGALPADAETVARTVLRWSGLELRGLMTVPPFSEDPEASRPFFAELAALRERLQDRLGHPLPELSMGMSHDFEVAIEEGATIVRVGTAIFGRRR